MPQFVRPAAWLRQLFTQSRTEHSNPARVSPDVSLTQPYDGGGWGMEDPGMWIVAKTSAVGIDTTTVIHTVGSKNICRIMAASCILAAGGKPTYVAVAVEDPMAALGVGITPIADLVADVAVNLPIMIPIVGPTHQIVGRIEGGDALTQVHWRIYKCELPLGSSPTI